MLLASACLNPVPLTEVFCLPQEYELFSTEHLNNLTPVKWAPVNQSITLRLWETDACAADKTYFFMYNTCKYPVNVTYEVRPALYSP